MVDDNSTDGTFEKCRDYSNKLSIKRTKMEDYYRQEEWLYAEAWDFVREVAKEGDWIVTLDSDEILEPSFLTMKDSLMQNDNFNCYSFQLIHVWAKGHFRVGRFWGGRWKRMFFRFENHSMETQLKEGIHHGGFPRYAVKNYSPIPLSCGIMHYGYSTDEMRKFKTEKYLKYSKATGDIRCAQTILEKPILIKFEDRLKIMKELQLGPILNNPQIGEFIRGMEEKGI